MPQWQNSTVIIKNTILSHPFFNRHRQCCLFWITSATSFLITESSSVRADMIAYARGSSCAFILLEGISYTHHVHYTDGICAPVQPIRLFYAWGCSYTEEKQTTNGWFWSFQKDKRFFFCRRQSSKLRHNKRLGQFNSTNPSINVRYTICWLLFYLCCRMQPLQSVHAIINKC